MTPTYYRQPQVDPWLVAGYHGDQLCVVIAQWDNAQRQPSACPTLHDRMTPVTDPGLRS